MTDAAVESAAASALELIADGTRIGLGTGHATAVFVARLAERVRSGLRLVGVPTSEATAAQARSLGIPLGTLDDGEELALTVDGADEVAPNLDLVKGFGGALVRERIVAAASRRQVILVGHDKLVDRLATRGRIRALADAGMTIAVAGTSVFDPRAPVALNVRALRAACGSVRAPDIPR